jgi:transcriptional regulator with XRE-family HTH domain
MTITPAQVRMARAGLQWRRVDLARASGMAAISIKQIELGKVSARDSSMAKLESALRAAGVEFGVGTVELKKATG